MKSYPLYQDTGIKWLGRIPNSWCVKRIKHNTYVKGRVGWQGLNSNEFGSFGPCLVTGTDFKNGRIDWETCYHVSIERYDEDPFIQLQNQDLLITKDGTIGKVAIVENLKGHATLNSGVFVTRPLNNDYITPYLYWLLNSNVFNLYIDYTKTGSTVQHLYQATFVEFSFPVPSIPEQQAIADYLDRKTAQIDTLIAKKQRQIELLQEQRTAIINQAVTKGLEPYVPMKDSGIEWLGNIPKHWDILRIRWISSIVNGSTPDSTISEYWDGDITWVTPFDLGLQNGKKLICDSSRKITHTGLNNCGASVTPKGSIILSTRAPIGHLAISGSDTCTNQGCKTIVVTQEQFNNSFLYYYLLAFKEVLQSLGRGSTFIELSSSNLKDFVVTCPNPVEQQSIADFLDHMTAQIDELVTKTQKSIDYYQEYRTALITEAVTGKIDVRGEA